jgi:hypothetical protein
LNNLGKMAKWAINLRTAAFLSGFATIFYSLLMFATIKELGNPDPNAPATTLGITRDIFGSISFVGNAWFVLSLMGFTFHATKFLRGRTGNSGWTPGWAIAAWLVPFCYLVIPYLMLRNITDASQPKDLRAARGKLIGFWIIWMGILLMGNVSTVSIAFGQGNMAEQGWEFFAGIEAFLIVPMMQARAFFRQLERDLLDLQEPEIVAYDLKANGW